MTGPAKIDAPRPDEPQAGFYKTKMVRGGPWVPVRLWYGEPLDPETGERLDRSPRWQCLVGQDWRDPFATWPRCCDRPISADEYRFLIDDADWCKKFAPQEPPANPGAAIDLNRIDPIF